MVLAAKTKSFGGNFVKKILIMDEKNYNLNLEEIHRVAVRGIIFINEKLLLIQSDFGEVKFPGGGQEDGEDDFQTLIRETLEETCYHINPESIREFGEVEEKRLSLHEPMIWHQINRYYFCDVKDVQEECNYTDNESKYGFHQVLYTLDEALKIYQNLKVSEGKHAWNQREFNVLQLLTKVFPCSTS